MTRPDAPHKHGLPQRRQMPWPLPALLTWAACWALFMALGLLYIPVVWSLALATGLGLAAGLQADSGWRKLFIAAGFPLSLAASNLGVDLPPWAWLIPLALLLLLYPMSAWRDAPLFPTPQGILDGLDRVAPLQCTDRVLDAGCGLGAGLTELFRVYPLARLDGIERSWPLRFLCAWRCPFARVRHGDIWQEDWSPYSMVYMFQRPESMGPATEKARRELSKGSWLVSLEFEAPALKPVAVLQNRADKPVWVYRIE
ncbi:MAG: class I SAM-dependent methyltransferase [Desulfomicrobium sp.]|nr:class I SAM-dependent methyltransferase [Pseudomonadota bacterium]MBV1711150.1 class I SAM-dependent methyltransferase [Desulfomicrobium sp.]MBU4569821.1 class I SAM-dependent methyltransferase [Pseudomonadota bacterium]MBU4594919.1 class I SAM-dependent methyltransferase [Pseudomonadota bacterium]MBV1718960.1 class I SAM-dependent methyltransferase [Desulfomicrobium sp.]